MDRIDEYLAKYSKTREKSEEEARKDLMFKIYEQYVIDDNKIPRKNANEVSTM